MLTRKLKTSIKIFKEKGIKSLLIHLFKKLINFKSPSKNKYFHEINRCVINEKNTFHLNIAKELANAVFYVYGMGVKGDIAEFGTMTGRSAVALSKASALCEIDYRNDPRALKNLHFFDSFEGLPEARFDIDKSSPHVLEGTWKEGSCKGLSKNGFTKLISRYINNKKFKVYKGWFKDTVHQINADINFSLVHIDGDLYESAIDVLDFLFKKKKISKGAILLFDDWNCNASNPDLGEKKAFKEVCDKYKIKFSDEGSYSFNAHKFIIHSYE